MGHGETNTILSKLREHVRQGQGGKALELVDVHEEVSAFGGRRVCPAKGGKPNGRDEQSAKERRAIFANIPLGQVYQEHLALVHNPADVQIRLGCRQYPTEQWVGQKRSDLVLDWRCTIRAVAE